jgi:hypothetical protein
LIDSKNMSCKPPRLFHVELHPPPLTRRSLLCIYPLTERESVFNTILATYSDPLIMTDIEEATVTFTKSKVTAKWLASEKLSILELAEKAGLEPLYGCRSAMCCVKLKGKRLTRDTWTPCGVSRGSS